MNKFLAVYGKPRYLGIVEYDGEIKRSTTLVVESVRGEELATVIGEIGAEQEERYRRMRNTAEHGDGLGKNSEPVVTDLKFISFAGDADMETADVYRCEEKAALLQAKELLKPHALDMKLIDVEYLRAKRKLFLYFSSEQRVDFRAYVRDLAREFRTRIELRQIGVRDEAKIIRGMGPCGRPCCCSYWLSQFSPIGIKMVKEQNLALNPTKISGLCGRLMCCMCYEHEAYREAWQDLPNPGSKIKTPNGNVVIAGIDLSDQCLRCHMAGRGEIKVPKDQFEEFKEVVSSGGEWAVPEEEHESIFKLDDIFSKNLARAVKAKEEQREKEKKEAREGREKQQKVRRRSEDSAQQEERPSQERRRRRRRPRSERQQMDDEEMSLSPQSAQRAANARRQADNSKESRGGEPRRRRPRRRNRGVRPSEENAAVKEEA